MLSLIPVIGPFLAIPEFLMNNWKLLVAIVFAAVLVAFVWSWDHRGKEAAILEQQNAVLIDDIGVLEKQALLMREAMHNAALRATEQQHDSDSFNRISEEAYHAPKTDDAPIAPVLRRGLDSLGKLLQHSGRP